MKITDYCVTTRMYPEGDIKTDIFVEFDDGTSNTWMDGLIDVPKSPVASLYALPAEQVEQRLEVWLGTEEEVELIQDENCYTLRGADDRKIDIYLD